MEQGGLDSEIACLEVESESVAVEKESEEVGESNGQDAIRCRSSILPTPAHVVLPRSVRGPVSKTPETLAVIEDWAGRAGRAATRSDWHPTRARAMTAT